MNNESTTQLYFSHYINMVQSTDAFKLDWHGILSLCERCFMDAIKSTSSSQYILAKNS